VELRKWAGENKKKTPHEKSEEKRREEKNE
jgi:hypothetical protein